MLLESIVYPLCSTAPETIGHIIFLFSASRAIWSLVTSWCQTDDPGLLQANGVWQGIVYIIVWCLWKVRNGVVMQTIHWQAFRIFAGIQVLSYLWLSSRNRKLHISWTDCLLTPFYGQPSCCDDIFLYQIKADCYGN